jgi:FkbM family methyltransferase
VLLPVEIPFTRHQWPAAAHIASRVARPVDDPRVVVLETPHEDPSGLYESLAHSDAVVALNTTAELEAGIVGRPVFTIRPDTTEDDGQQATLHFHYLTREHGGFVWAASGLAEHVQQLENALTAGADPAVIRSFIESFLRPHGLDRPVVPLLVDALESSARDSQAPRPVDLSSSPAFPHSVSGSHVVPLSYGDSTIRVRATPEALSRVTDHGAVRLDRATVKWLHRVVNERDVVYDVNAGFGPYTLIACHRGASVVAFEPAHAAYAALCENVALNGCHDAVVPIPLPLAGHDGLGDSRRRPLNRTDRKMQALCWSRLDTLVERYDLPPATHMRLSANVSAFDVLDGAERTVANAALRTIWLEIPMDREAEMAERLRASGLSIELRKERRKTVKLLFVRQKVVLDT